LRGNPVDDVREIVDMVQSIADVCELDVVTEVLDPAKDVDGIHPQNVGSLALGYTGLDFFQPATPLAGMEILKRYNLPVSGKRA